ncbi:MAG TPA: hypothetical protein VJ508_04135, partial [Saprospiraceae bacterium]|nr:hypothetical protein [Saprospiraceae bacterium]
PGEWIAQAHKSVPSKMVRNTRCFSNPIKLQIALIARTRRRGSHITGVYYINRILLFLFGHQTRFLF